MSPFESGLHTTRRTMLGGGLSALAGLSLADTLRAQEETPASTPRKVKSVIMVCLAGGPSHIDMYDLKPEAPLDYRGLFKPIATNVPGFDISECFPLQAQIADKLALVRSLQFFEPMQHELEEVYTGFPKSQQRPAFGSVISRFGKTDPKLPSYVSLEYAHSVVAYENPQYLGAVHTPMHVSGGDGVTNMGLMYGIPPNRFATRKELMSSLDSLERRLDKCREMSTIDTYNAKALELLTSKKARQAFDLTLEPQSVLDRYGRRDDKFAYIGPTADEIWDSHKFLLARRLVEAGVPIIKMRMGVWDHHGNVIQSAGGGDIWRCLRSQLPRLDRSIHALVTDLHERGLDKETLVLVWGEFGRTPKISLAGRDHWPEASFALFAGAVHGGQVIGETDSRAERPRNNPLTAQNVIGTVYQSLGIDWRAKVNDFGGRPTQLLDDGRAIEGLLL